MLIYISLPRFGCELFAMVTKRNQYLRGCCTVDVLVRVPLIINAKWLWQTPARQSGAVVGCGQSRADDSSFRSEISPKETKMLL